MGIRRKRVVQKRTNLIISDTEKVKKTSRPAREYNRNGAIFSIETLWETRITVDIIIIDIERNLHLRMDYLRVIDVRLAIPRPTHARRAEIPLAP